MATHDAYYWLAKANGVGNLSKYPLSVAAKSLHDLTGMQLGTIGFWTPAFMSSLVGVVCMLWGWLLGGRNAGIMAGLVGALTPGFFYRSRLGYFDSDMFTLLMPMTVAWMQAYWASKHLKQGWFIDSAESGPNNKNSSLWLALGFGLATRFAGIWHHDIVNFCVLLFFMTSGMILINGRSGHRNKALSELAVYGLAAFPGINAGLLVWPMIAIPINAIGLSHGFLSMVLAIGMAFALVYSRQKNLKAISAPWFGASILLVVILLAGILNNPIVTVVAKLSGYLSPADSEILTSENTAAGPIYPSVVQSIIEAKRIGFGTLFERGAFFAWVGGIAVLCSLVALVRTPMAVFLFPLVFLYLASVKIGVRFSMFGGAALIVYLGVCIHWLTSLLVSGSQRKRWIQLGVQGLIGLAFLVHCKNSYSQIPITPVIPKVHAEALIELGEQANADEMAWTWWDWGYATQYYAGLETVVDGGKHAGKDVYPVAFVLSTDSSERANRMIAFSAQYPAANKNDLGLTPYVKWNDVSRSEIEQTLELQLSKIDYPATTTQYVVVSWKDLVVAKWITYFGNWNLETGETKEATVSNFDPGQLGINFQKGAIMNRKGGGGLVKDITVLDKGSAETKTYYMNAFAPQLLPKQQHLIVNKVSRQSVLMDRTGYRSMMTRLLIGDPNDPEISKYFKIVVDKLPFARIYEVVQ